MVVGLKHVGITDWDKARLKMSVKTLGSWFVQALRARPGIPSGPGGLGFTHIGHEAKSHSHPEQQGLSDKTVLFFSKRA